ncbi:hypothetical protein [Micromonospora sp. NBC_01813]|uniref:hypothetical protein n=1 Tax=Micromonospora sp. NBC_01813 TaxID=2975988 RepID=UPI002DDA7D9B|nr:hypothetical protein [Micromonospora sp. NBC_01813]WSA08383.1 hypothetical protein OG958_30050 [Micromonospora sp. NBC_01813]
MRHLWSFLSGLAVAPICWLLIALGQTTSTRTITDWVSDGRYHTATLLAPAAFLLVAGLSLGLLGTLRVSPLGPLVAGLTLAAPYVAMFIVPLRTREIIGTQWQILGEPVVLLQPVENGTLALLGVLLSTAVFSRRRWRSRPAGADPDAAADPTTAAAEPLPVRPLGEFDPSLWSLPGGSTDPTPASTAPTLAEPDQVTGGRPATATLTAPVDDRSATADGPGRDAQAGDGGDRLRPARPFPRSSRVIR